MARTTFTGPVRSLNGFEGEFTATQVVLQSNNANTITLDAPSGLAASYTLLLPPNDGTSGQVLTTDGNGVTTWTTNGAGTVTSVGGTGTVNGLTLTGTVTSSGSLTLGGTLDLSSPPAIGGSAAAAGTFTNLTANTSVTLADAVNIAVNATTGTKIGTATSQKIAFYNSTPIVQPATTGTVTGFTAGSGTAVKDDSTFTGDTGATAYTIGDVVKALKSLGLLAA